MHKKVKCNITFKFSKKYFPIFVLNIKKHKSEQIKIIISEFLEKSWVYIKSQHLLYANEHFLNLSNNI